MALTEGSGGHFGDAGQTLQVVLSGILSKLEAEDEGVIFMQPVPVAHIPGYLDVISEPMDFSTVRSRLNDGEYLSVAGFEKDVMLIFSNAVSFNTPQSLISNEALRIKKIAESELRLLSVTPVPNSEATPDGPTTKREDKLAMFELLFSSLVLDTPVDVSLLPKYCICGRPGGGGFMIECTVGTGGCSGWIHPECFGLDEGEVCQGPICGLLSPPFIHKSLSVLPLVLDPHGFIHTKR
jgi:hypothetical protein